MTERRRRGRTPGPRIRTVKPEIWQEEAIGSVSRDARLLLIVLRSMADDEGRLRALPALIVGHGYAYDEDVTPAKLRRWLAELEEHGLIVRYEVDRRPYVVIRHWRSYQRIEKGTRSRLPEPPDPDIVRENALDSDDGTVPESSGRNTGAVPDLSANPPSLARGGARPGADPGRGPRSTDTPGDQQPGARATPAGVVDQHSLPDDFPAALAERAERVLIGLRAIQQRVSPHSAPPTLYRVGLAMRAFPDLDHLHIVQRLEMWAMDPKRLAGRHRHGRDLDIPGLFLEFCRRAQGDGRVTPAPTGGSSASAREVLAAREQMREQRRAAVRR